MDLASFHLLLTPSGIEALQAAARLEPRENDFLQHYDRLRRRYPPDLAKAALETAILRIEAQVKFPRAEGMFFTREALEQASSFAVSAYRAGRYRGLKRVIDLGCSIGGDTLALASQTYTLGIDRDPLRLAMAQANLSAHGLAGAAEWVCADLLKALPLAPASSSAAFFDPARRRDGKRIFSVRDYQPPLSIVSDWLPRLPALGVKISPGVDLAELADYPAEVEFISWRGELKEAVLWFGPLQTCLKRATLLPGAHTLENYHPEIKQLGMGEPSAILYEPDPAVLRAGLVAQVGEQLNAVQLDPDIAYLTASQRKETPFARAWTVEDWFPFNLKRLRAYLRERNVGHVIVKKRGSPIQPEALIQDLRLSGEGEKTIFLTHLSGKPIVIVAKDKLDTVTG